MTPRERAEQLVAHVENSISADASPAWAERAKRRLNEARDRKVAEIENAIKEAIAAEREACAKLADHETQTADKLIPMCGQYKARCIAAVIRARGDKT